MAGCADGRWTWYRRYAFNIRRQRSSVLTELCSEDNLCRVDTV